MSNQNQKNEWGLAYHPPTTNLREFPVAEPQHRAAPKGISSGLSFRQLPACSVEAVKKACIHYVEKCSGQYNNNKMAARYLHQLASEVLAQLNSISKQIEQNQEFAQLLQIEKDEWEKQFPASLYSFGTPVEIAGLMKEQSKELEKLRKQAAEAETERHQTMGNMLRSMDAQLQASREGALSERHHLGSEIQNIKLAFDIRFQNLENSRMKEIGSLKNAHTAEMRSAKSRFQQEKDEMKDRFDAEKETLLKEISDLKFETMHLTEDLNKKQKALEDFRYEVDDLRSKSWQSQSDASDLESVGDDISLQSSMPSEFLSASDFDDDTISQNLSTGDLPPRSRRRKGKKAGEKSRIYKIFQKKIKKLKQDIATKEEMINQASDERDNLRAEVALITKKITNLQKNNELLRAALERNSGRKENIQHTGKVLSFQAKPLSRVPDFLQNNLSLKL